MGRKVLERKVYKSHLFMVSNVLSFAAREYTCQLRYLGRRWTWPTKYHAADHDNMGTASRIFYPQSTLSPNHNAFVPE